VPGHGASMSAVAFAFLCRKICLVAAMVQTPGK
jgi:hypothetical protein